MQDILTEGHNSSKSQSDEQKFSEFKDLVDQFKVTNNITTESFSKQ